MSKQRKILQENDPNSTMTIIVSIILLVIIFMAVWSAVNLFAQPIIHWIGVQTLISVSVPCL